MILEMWQINKHGIEIYLCCIRFDEIQPTRHLLVERQYSRLGSIGFVCNKFELDIYSLSSQNLSVTTYFKVKKIMLGIIVKFVLQRRIQNPAKHLRWRILQK